MKAIDMSVLPDGFLVEWPHMNEHVDWLQPSCVFMNDGIRGFEGYRAALNYPHFNDGSLVLPDGLVVEFITADREALRGESCNGIIYVTSHGGNIVDDYDPTDIEAQTESYVIAVKILGVTAECGAQLGMEVIDINGDEWVKR